MLAALESYNAIKTGLADAIREVNRFVEDGYIEIDLGKCDKRKETRNLPRRRGRHHTDNIVQKYLHLFYYPKFFIIIARLTKIHTSPFEESSISQPLQLYFSEFGTSRLTKHSLLTPTQTIAA